MTTLSRCSVFVACFFRVTRQKPRAGAKLKNGGHLSQLVSALGCLSHHPAPLPASCVRSAITHQRAGCTTPRVRALNRMQISLPRDRQWPPDTSAATHIRRPGIHRRRRGAAAHDTSAAIAPSTPGRRVGGQRGASRGGQTRSASGAPAADGASRHTALRASRKPRRRDGRLCQPSAHRGTALTAMASAGGDSDPGVSTDFLGNFCLVNAVACRLLPPVQLRA